MHYSGFLIVILAGVFSHPVNSESQSNFVVPNFMTNWHSAVEYCNVLGRRLAVIDSSHKESELIVAIERSGIFHPKKTPVWIGANDLANDGFFYWRATGGRVIWSNWAENQPDNAAGGENCAEMGQYIRFGTKWQWNDNNCGLVRFLPANWFKAAEYCQYLGLRLAVIDSAEKEANLYSAIKASDVFNPASTRVWVGANDLAEEGNFHWQATGKRVRYANWAPSEPNNWNNQEHCVEVGIETRSDVYQLAWQWNDNICQKMFYFACEEAMFQI